MAIRTRADTKHKREYDCSRIVIQVRYITISVFWHHLLITTPMRARTAGLREKYRGREGATFGVWRFTFGVLRFTFGVSRLAFRVSFRVSRLTFGVWRFVSRFATFGVWRFVSPFAFRILWALPDTAMQYLIIIAVVSSGLRMRA